MEGEKSNSLSDYDEDSPYPKDGSPLNEANQSVRDFAKHIEDEFKKTLNAQEFETDLMKTTASKFTIKLIKDEALI
jgi:hypothetical protein